MPEQLKNITVRSLMMQQENKWDDDILNDICNDRDAELIKRIPLPAFDKQDSWFWLFDDKGVFTVKSCYRKLQGEQNTSQGAFWKKLWAIKLPGKVVNFMWRACNSCLPTTVALVTKRVQIDIKCPWCRTENEDAIHVLFTCSFARSVWDASRLHHILEILPGDTVYDVIHRVYAVATNEQIVLITLLCWNIWNRRNKWVWDKINMSAFGVQAAAMSLLDDWRKVYPRGAPSVSGRNISLKRWSRPAQGWVKINTDAARFEHLKCTGMTRGISCELEVVGLGVCCSHGKQRH